MILFSLVSAALLLLVLGEGKQKASMSARNVSHGSSERTERTRSSVSRSLGRKLVNGRSLELQTAASFLASLRYRDCRIKEGWSVHAYTETLPHSGTYPKKY
jgi:hypothetical protein